MIKKTTINVISYSLLLACTLVTTLEANNSQGKNENNPLNPIIKSETGKHLNADSAKDEPLVITLNTGKCIIKSRVGKQFLICPKTSSACQEDFNAALFMARRKKPCATNPCTSVEKQQQRQAALDQLSPSCKSETEA